MTSEFFDQETLKAINTDEYPIVEQYKDLQVFLKSGDTNILQLWLEINDQRLNSSEIKALLAYNQKNNILNKNEEVLLGYLGHKLVSIQTIYKIIGDKQLIFTYLQDISFPIFLDEEETIFSKEDKKLDFSFTFDDQSNINLEVLTEGSAIITLQDVYFREKGSISRLSTEIPQTFYKQIFEGKTKFTINGFVELKNTLLEKLQKIHNVIISEEVEKLATLDIEQKIAPIVVEVGKTSHFITLELKYEIGDERFPVDNYKYAQTSSWPDKEMNIKIIREEGKLIRYISDLEMTDDIFELLIQSTRVRSSKSSSNPFQIMFPTTSLETVVRRIIPELEKEFRVVYKDGQTLELENTAVTFDLWTNLSRRNDLLEFQVKFKIKEQYVTLEFLKDLMLQNRKYVQLDDGTTANIENIREINKWIEFLTRFDFRKSGDKYKAPSVTALQLDEFLDTIGNSKMKSNEEYKEIIQELKERKPIQPIDIPEQVDHILREYQKEGVYWMYFLKKYGFGGILADEMGLGKTVQALTMLRLIKEKTHLIVCPKSLIYNWENEIKKYFPETSVLIVDKDSDKRKRMISESENYDIVITSYSMLQKDVDEYLEHDIEFGYLVLDEAHYVKNIKTLSSKAVRTISAENKLLLTGTPLENNLDELYGTFELIMPGYLGSLSEFKRDFVSKIERNNTIALEILQAKIKPFILRRTKDQVLKELPEKQEQIVYNEMTNKQVAIYNEVLRRVKSDVEELVKEQGFEKSRIQILSALLKLRQVCNHPSLVDQSFRGEEDISGKYDQFRELLAETIKSGRKILLFSQFTSMLDIFEKDLKEEDINYLRLDGSTKNRQELVDQFNEDESVSVFLISLKAGGVGLNLTAANVVFLYDPWWNPMAEQQAIDRAHRIGQQQRVNIYKFITKNSIEEKILKLQERKDNLFENLITEETGFIKRLEYEDLMELFE